MLLQLKPIPMPTTSLIPIAKSLGHFTWATHIHAASSTAATANRGAEIFRVLLLRSSPFDKALPTGPSSYLEVACYDQTSYQWTTSNPLKAR